MAHRYTVLKSINLPGETICVDIFRRADGSYGFDTFRRDPEDGRGWYSIGHHSTARFDSEAATLAAARREITWLDDAMEG